MMNEKKEQMMNITNKEFRVVFDKIYDGAYHNGRHDERRRLSVDGWLCLNPNKILEFEKACQDPCVTCERHQKSLKKGCTISAECEKKQYQLRAIEIKSWFK